MAVENSSAAFSGTRTRSFAIFFRTISGHHPQDSGKSKLDEWAFVVIAGSVSRGFIVFRFPSVNAR
jgi:hypothetical protein